MYVYCILFQNSIRVELCAASLHYWAVADEAAQQEKANAEKAAAEKAVGEKAAATTASQSAEA